MRLSGCSGLKEKHECCSDRMQLCECEHCNCEKMVESVLPEFGGVHTACGCENVLVWIHLGILLTRGGELAASSYLCCSALAAFDDVGPTLLGALAGEAVLLESQGQQPGLRRCSSDLRDISQCYCVSRRRQAGSTGPQSPGRRIATGGPSESVVSDRMAARARQLIRLAPGRGRGRWDAG